MRSNVVSQEIYLGAAKLALCDVDDEAMLLEALKQLSKVDFMLSGIFAGHQDIIHIHKDEI